MSQEKDCDTCKHHTPGSMTLVCSSCFGSGATEPRNWAPLDDEAIIAGRLQRMTQKAAMEFIRQEPPKTASDGSTASYYVLPKDATELQDLIAFKDMNAQVGEIFRACYRYGQVAHSPKIRDIKKIIFYANEELKRLQKYGEQSA